MQVSDGRGYGPPTTVDVRKLEWLPFHVVSEYLHCIVWFCHKACVRWTARQMDRII